MKISDQLREQLPPIAEVANLKSVGTQWEGPCPICRTGTDRFFVKKSSPDRYYCRQCNGGGQGGNIIDFHMRLGGYPSMMDLARAKGIIGEKKKKMQKARVNAKNLTATYEYKDEAGNILFYVGRYEEQCKKKTFRQWQKKDGKRIRNVKGVKRVPYQLPLVVDSDMVFIVEGEKDATRLTKEGLTATCFVSSKWRDEYKQYFEGKEVFILPDNDGPGEILAKTIARATGGKIVMLTGLQEGGDVSDWLDAGNSIDDFWGEVDKAQPIEEKIDPEPKRNRIYTLSEYLKADFPPPTPLIGNSHNAFLVRGEGMFEAGRSGTGKTMLSTDMAVKMAMGYDFLKYPVPEPLKVLIYQAELPNSFFQQRLQYLIKAYSLGNKELTAASMDNLFIVDVKKPFNIAEKDNTAVEVVGEGADKWGADVIIIDPFLSFYLGDENVNPEVRRGLDLLKAGVAEKLNLGIIISDHQPKYSNVTQGQEHSMRGAGAKHDWAAAVMAISSTKTPVGEHGDFLKVHIDKLRYGPKPRDPFIIRRDTHTGMHSLWEGETVDPIMVAEVLNDIGGKASRTRIRETVMEEFEVSRRISDKFICDAVEAGFIETEKGSRGAINHVLGKKYLNERKRF